MTFAPHFTSFLESPHTVSSPGTAGGTPASLRAPGRLTLAKLLDLERGEEQVADVHRVLGQVGAVVGDAVEDHAPRVVDDRAHLRLLGRLHQHLLDQKTWPRGGRTHV